MLKFADFREPESNAHTLDVHIHCGFAIYYWDDLADRHIKVLRIRRADVRFAVVSAGAGRR